MPSAFQFRRVLAPGAAAGRRAVPFVGPLDEFADGLLDAFSAEFRLLTTWEGGLFRVRESTGSTEAVIGVTPEGRFDADAFNAHIGAGDGLAVRWLNQAGGTDCVQTSDATKQGKILLNQVGGGAALAMDDSNDGYAAIRTLARPWTIYLVEKGAVNGRTVSRVLQSNNNCVLSPARDGANQAFIGGGVASYTVAENTPVVVALTAPSGSGASYYVDAVDRTDTPGNTNEWGDLYLGAGAGAAASAEPPNSRVCELLVYGVAHDASTVATITALLKGLRGIT